MSGRLGIEYYCLSVGSGDQISCIHTVVQLHDSVRSKQDILLIILRDICHFSYIVHGLRRLSLVVNYLDLPFWIFLMNEAANSLRSWVDSAFILHLEAVV